jgi:methionyl-tRNA formyltransferase
MRILLFGGSVGVETALEACGPGLVGIVAASNRPDDLPQVAELAAAAHVPLYIQPARRDAEARSRFEDALRHLGPDLFLVNAYSMILPAPWLEIPPRGAINVHTGLLPQYRGANVLNWVLVNGESETGVTIHVIDEGIDTGPIVMRRQVPITDDDTVVTLRDRLLAEIGPMLGEVLPLVAAGSVQTFAQDEAQARYWPRRTPEDGRIDPTLSTKRIYDLVRALVRPWPGAFYYDVAGGRITLDTFHTYDEIEQLRDNIADPPTLTRPDRRDPPA